MSRISSNQQNVGTVLPSQPGNSQHAALARWDNEGGALSATVLADHRELPVMSNAEIVLLRVRVIALENILVAVLATGSDRQVQAARDMADVISPHPEATQHPLTIRAAQHMDSIVHRALHIRKTTA